MKLFANNLIERERFLSLIEIVAMAFLPRRNGSNRACLSLGHILSDNEHVAMLFCEVSWIVTTQIYENSRLRPLYVSGRS